MKKWILIVLLLCSRLISQAQESIVTLTPDMFNPINEILIADMDGWTFSREGENKWVRLKPTELSGKLADNNGRVGGWLRFRFRLSPAFGDTALYFRYSGWAAAILYLDSTPIQTFGIVGTDKSSFKEYNPSNKMPMKVNMQAGSVHEITIRFADYINPVSTKEIKSAAARLHQFIRITGPAYHARFAKHIREWPIYSSVWLSICMVLTLLFWLLAFLNRQEKNLSLFAICASLFLVTFFCKVHSENPFISFNGFLLSFGAFNFLSSVSNCLTLFIVAKVFKGKVSVWLKTVIALLFVLGVVNVFVTQESMAALSTLVPVFVYLWYIFSSRKTLRGAQWAIVFGLLLFSLLVFAYVVMLTIYQTDFVPYNMLIASGLILAFPLSLLVYVALRFKEIVSEVRLQAAQVVRLSEEKKEQALQQQKLLEEEVARQTIELRTSLDNLRATQKQLIQSEKMASLGELTAGIAHEIQNPLNFVNNFSELNTELVSELQEEADKGNTAEVKSIAADIRENSEKISHHGKRADAIVKGMLQHSSSGSGKKELTDINTLADEYLRLAYHGLRAKDKSFNATMKTDFDNSIDKVNIISQDIGRVILNLINNAFYAVAERKKLGEAGYEPTVELSTKHSPLPGRGVGGEVTIVVKDNGFGIPPSILDKIFQPFFTTKPTGQGTGLGLSLSYDIVKAHGGEISVDTIDGQGTTFTIILPVTA